MAKGQPEDRALAEKEERRRKKALKKAKRQDREDGGEAPSIGAVDEANGKPKKAKKTKKRKPEGSAEESGADSLMVTTNGVPEVKVRRSSMIRLMVTGRDDAVERCSKPSHKRYAVH